MEHYKKKLAMLLAVLMGISSVHADVSASAIGNVAQSWKAPEESAKEWDGETTEDVCESENYRVIFSLQSVWGSGYNASVRIENTGDSEIRNWCLAFDYADSLNNIWNAEVVSHTDTRYLIKNLGWNRDIPAGSFAEFGLSVDGAPFSGFPQDYALKGTKQEVAPDDFGVELRMTDVWEDGYCAEVSVQNHSAQALEDWMLSFGLDDEIKDIWGARIESHADGTYNILNTMENGVIQPESSVTFGIRGNGIAEETELTQVRLYSYGMFEGENPDESQPDTDNPGENNPDTDDPGEDNPDIDNPGTDTPDIDDPGTDTPDIDDPGTDTPDIDDPGTDNPDIDDPGTDTPDIDDPGTDNPDIDDPGTDNPDIDDPGIGDFGTDEEPGQTEPGMEDIDPDRDRLLDTDGDGICDYMEKISGMDYTKADTDDDGLTDFEEYLSMVLDPCKADTDGNGIYDGEEDTDGDGLTNLEESRIGSRLSVPDTDHDGLTDGEECHVYGTDPLSMDTDGDGLTDKDELLLGCDPLRADTDGDGIPDGQQKIAQSTRLTVGNAEKKEVVSVSVDLSCAGNIEDSVTILDMYGNDVYSSNVAGLVGIPVDISCRADFDRAVITFAYDRQALGDTREENLCMLWYDEANGRYVVLDSVLDTGAQTVSYVTDHFSQYMLVDREKWEAAFREPEAAQPENVQAGGNDALAKGVPDSAYFDLALCFDYSVSKEELAQEKKVARALIMQMQKNDRVKLGVYLPNNFNTYHLNTWSTNRTSALYILDNLEKQLHEQYKEVNLSAPSGNYLAENYQAIVRLADNMMSDARYQSGIAFLLNAGKNEDILKPFFIISKEQAASTLRSADYVVRSISVTEKENQELAELLKKYGGNSYDCSVMMDIRREYGFDLPGEDDLDSDGDGIKDVYEIHGIRMSNGQVIYTDPENSDTDNDGLDDLEELISLEERETVITGGEIYKYAVGHMRTDPSKEDTDDDGLSDLDEILIGTSPTQADTDGDELGDGIEVMLHFDPLHTDIDGDGRNDKQEYEDGTNPYLYNKSWNEYLADFLIGAIAGDFEKDGSSIPMLAGKLVGSFVPLMDLRDMLANLTAGDYLFAGLNLLGVVPVAGDIAKSAGYVGKFLTKNADDIPRIAEAMEMTSKISPQTIKAMGKTDEFADTVKGIARTDEIVLSKKSMEAMEEVIEQAGKTDELLTSGKSLKLKNRIQFEKKPWNQLPIADGQYVDVKINGHPLPDGTPVEGLLKGRGLGINFPAFDRLVEDERLLVSTKCIDLGTPGYQRVSQLKGRLNSCVKKMMKFDEPKSRYFDKDGVCKWGETVLKRSEYDKKVLEIFFPDVPITEEIKNVLDSFKDAMDSDIFEVWYNIAE